MHLNNVLCVPGFGLVGISPLWPRLFVNAMDNKHVPGTANVGLRFAYERDGIGQPIVYSSIYQHTSVSVYHIRHHDHSAS